MRGTDERRKQNPCRMTSVLSTNYKAGLFTERSFRRVLWGATRVNGGHRGLLGSSQFSGKWIAPS
jgi:hypothetical protein